jgi:hypothetical protein
LAAACGRQPINRSHYKEHAMTIRQYLMKARQDDAQRAGE